jgi:hypothetical protein
MNNESPRVIGKMQLEWVEPPWWALFRAAEAPVLCVEPGVKHCGGENQIKFKKM